MATGGGNINIFGDVGYDDSSSVMATGGGNLNIFGDVGYDASSSLKTYGIIESEEAEKLLFFFYKELIEEAERVHLDLEIYNTMPRIEVRSRSSERKTAQEFVKRWTDRLERELWKKSISGEDEGTLDQVKKVIRKCKQQVYVLPVQSKSRSRVVWIYSRYKTELDHVIKAYSSTEPMVEMAPAKPQPVNTPRNSQNMNAGSYVDSTSKFKFTTNENLHVRLYKRGINSLKVDAIVSAANNELANVGGVAEIISKAAGFDMERECEARIRQEGKVRDGSNVVTNAGKLPYKAVIHAVGPRWHGYRDKAKCLCVLMDTVINILKTAEDCKFRTIAMPPISSGIFSVPKQMCAAMYFKGIIKFSKEEKLGSLQEFHIIDINDDVLDMVKEWYDRYTRDRRCLNLDEVLKSIPFPAHNKHSTGYNIFQDYSKSRTGSTAGSSAEFKGAQVNISKHDLSAQVINLTDKTDVHIYSKEILQLKGIDVVAVTEDPHVSGNGLLSTALLDAGDNIYRKEHRAIQDLTTQNQGHHTGEVLVTIAGDNLPFSHVVHAIIEPDKHLVGDSFQKHLSKVYTNVLTTANRLMKEKKWIRLAIPLIGLETQRNIIAINSCCQTVVNAVTKYLQTTPNVRISEVNLFDTDDQVTKTLQNLFAKKTAV